jgi:putative PIN family toxin of toxin-antitoxin system
MSVAIPLARVVIDLNQFVSGLISSQGQPRRLLDHFRHGSFTLVISHQVRDELDEVLQREKFSTRFGLTPEQRAAFLSLVDARARFIEPLRRVPVAIRDPKDEIVLATALGGVADYLVTGDADLLVLKDDPSIGGLHILTVREVLTILDART